MLNRRFSIIVLSCLIIGTILSLPIMRTSRLTIVSLPENVRVSAAASTQTIALVGFISAWNNTSTPNPTITVTQGQNIMIQLSSGDAVEHRFFVDVDKNGPTPDCPGADVCSNIFPPSTSLPFTVNFASGIYTYYCSLHPTTMLGRFIVLPAPEPGGGGRHPVEL